MEITVGGETLSPRELIRSVPIAGMALTVPDGAITSEKLAVQYWNVTDDSESRWQTDIYQQYISVPEIDFLFTPSVNGVVLVDLSTNFRHSVADTQGFCAIGINENVVAKGNVFLSPANREMNCSTNIAYPVQAGQSYQFSLMVYSSQAGTFGVHKDSFTNLSAVFFGAP